MSERVDFLRGLAASDFLPDGDAVGAVAAATGMPLADEAGRARHREAVEAFAREYWSLAPDERARRWNDLSARGWADDRATAARLAHLKAGLSLKPAGFDEPKADAIARAIRELYVLPPRERAARRLAWLSANGGHPLAWANAAVKLRDAAAALFALEPVLSKRLIDAAWPPERELTPEQAFRFPRRSARVAPVPKLQNSGWNGCLIAFAVLTVLRLIATIGDRAPTTPSYTPTPPPYIPPPAFRTDTGKPPPRTTFLYKAAEVSSFKEYEKNPTGPPPKGYETWQKIGKPESDPLLEPPEWRR